MKVRRLFAALAMIAAVLMGTAACDTRPCLQGHYDYMPVITGKTVAIVPDWVCDVYGKATPNG
jgi:hypothetical protein